MVNIFNILVNTRIREIIKNINECSFNDQVLHILKQEEIVSSREYKKFQ